jgi:hypothetical protein
LVAAVTFASLFVGTKPGDKRVIGDKHFAADDDVRNLQALERLAKPLPVVDIQPFLQFRQGKKSPSRYSP